MTDRLIDMRGKTRVNSIYQSDEGGVLVRVPLPMYMNYLVSYMDITFNTQAK